MSASRSLLRGSDVYLNAIAEDDLPVIVAWYQDVGFLRLFDARAAAPRTVTQIGEEIAQKQKSPCDFSFAIRRVDTGALIGLVEIDGILWTHRIGGLGVAIGSAEHRGHGYGTQACRLALDFAFEELNLHRITATVFSYNTASRRLCERLGFQLEGVFREFLERDGQRHDMLLFGLLRHEWIARRP
ncbi:MAG: GNAT family N-acetyltransferase [Anaerolineae bacterium]|nr:GNAT family N-acetyltransferase [Anaerolineae bacterium]